RLPPVVLRPDLPRAFRYVAPRAHLRVTSRVEHLVSMVLQDCTVSIAAARPFAASKLAPRPTAPTATPATVTSATEAAMTMAVATVTGLMRQLRRTPMADPTPPLTTAATTSPPIGDTATGAFRSVTETD